MSADNYGWDPVDFEVGDLVTYVGEPVELHKHYVSTSAWQERLARRVVYRVTDRGTAPSTSPSRNAYVLEAAFDPAGLMRAGTVVTKFGSRNMKKLTLLDLCNVRLELDNLIRDTAKTCSE